MRQTLSLRDLFLGRLFGGIHCNLFEISVQIFWEGEGVVESRETFEGEVALKIRKLVVYFEETTQSNLPKDLEGV